MLIFYAFLVNSVCIIVVNLKVMYLACGFCYDMCFMMNYYVDVLFMCIFGYAIVIKPMICHFDFGRALRFSAL